MQIALFLGALVGLIIIPILGWRPMFWIAAIGAGIVWYLRKNIPESPRWLEQRGRLAEAEAIVRSIEIQSGDPPPPTTHAAPPPPTDVRSSAFLLRILVGTIVVVSLNTASFGLLQFIPTFFVNAGLSVTKSLGFATIMTAGGPVGGLIALVYADRVGRKRLLIASAVAAGFFASFYPFVGNGYLITLVGFLLVTALYVNSVAAFAMFVPELFPTDVRLRSVGTCHTIGRISGALMPFAVVALYGNFGIVGVITVMVAILLTQAVAVAGLAVEPRFRSLEDLGTAEALTDDAALSHRPVGASD